jgi:hypothetical protein
LHPGEDPSVFWWELEELLQLADPELNSDQMHALTAHQFMHNLPSDLQIKLPENDPVPTLEKMVTFAQNRWAIDRSPVIIPATKCCCIFTT